MNFIFMIKTLQPITFQNFVAARTVLHFSDLIWLLLFSNLFILYKVPQFLRESTSADIEIFKKNFISWYWIFFNHLIHHTLF